MKADLLLATLKRMTERGYVVIDLETTGLDPAKCEIAEIGLLVYRPGEVIQPKSWLVHCTTTEESTRITGITQAMADSGKPLDAALREALHAVHLAFDGERDPLDFSGEHLTIVGHNYLRYDADVFDYARPITSLAAAFSRKDDVVDTAALFKGGRLGWGQNEGESLLDYQMRVLNEKVFGLKYNLAYVCDELGVPHYDIQAHRAGGDVVMCHRILQKLLEKFEAYEAKRKAAV